jgi:hypothetical protein
MMLHECHYIHIITYIIYILYTYYNTLHTLTHTHILHLPLAAISYIKQSLASPSLRARGAERRDLSYAWRGDSKMAEYPRESGGEGGEEEGRGWRGRREVVREE